MPEIPQLPEQTRMQYTSPVEAADVGAAGRAGDAIQRLGAGVSNAGITIADVDARKTALKRNLDVQSASQQFISLAIGLKDKAVQGGKPDGSDYIDNFYSDYDKQSQQITKQFSDPVTQKEVQTAQLHARNTFAEQLSTLARHNFNLNTERQTGQILEQASAQVYQDPNLFDAQEQIVRSTVQGNVVNGASDPAVAKKVLDDHMVQMAQSAILGMIERDQYKQANDLLTTKYSKYMDFQQLAYTRNLITSSKTQKANLILQEENIRDRAAQKKVDDEQTRNYSNLTTMLINARTPDQEDQVQRLAIKLAAKNGIDSKQYSDFKTLQKDSQGGPFQEMAAFDVTERLLNGENPTVLRRQVGEQVRSSEISPTTGAALLNKIESHERISESNPTASKEWEAVRTQLKAKYLTLDNPYMRDFKKKEHMQEYAQALDEIAQTVKKEGVGPSAAASIVLKKKAAQEPSSVPLLSLPEQADSEDMKRGMVRLTNLYKNGTITKQQYTESLEAADRRMQYLLQGNK